MSDTDELEETATMLDRLDSFLKKSIPKLSERNQRIFMFWLLVVGRTLYFVIVFGVVLPLLWFSIEFWATRQELTAVGFVIASIASFIGAWQKRGTIVPEGGFGYPREDSE